MSDDEEGDCTMQTALVDLSELGSHSVLPRNVTARQVGRPPQGAQTEVRPSGRPGGDGEMGG